MKASLATLTTKDLISAFEENEDIDDVIEMIEVKEGKNKKIFRKKELQAKKAELPQRIKVAAAGWGLGRYSTVAACARAYRVNRNLLYAGIVRADGQFRGSGQFSVILNKSEGEKIASHARHLAKIGCGLS